VRSGAERSRAHLPAPAAALGAGIAHTTATCATGIHHRNGGGSMSIANIGIIARLELTQRLRSVGWYILLGVFALVLLGITGLAFAVYSWGDAVGAGVYSIVVNIVLLLVVLVSPTLSGNAINGDREAATLAAVQVTAASTGDIMIGKLVAAVATGGAFLAVALPFLALSLLGGGADPLVLLVSLLVLAAEIIIVAAIGVGLSGLIARPLFSVAATYLVVSALVVGTLIVFGLGGMAIRSEGTSYSRPYDVDGSPDCTRWEVNSRLEVPRYDLVWWVLAANPFVVLADATPTEYSPEGYPVDMFGQIKFGLRSAQQSPLEQRWDDCGTNEYRTPKEVIESSVPSWFVGLGVQVVIAGSLFAGAWARTRTPAKRLPPGTRIA
ncbi:ABC transporter permease, partial [Microbacterium sp. LB16]|uniref:ABC transporter permease n=2 Tax=unclassified Microbacterium TaxID=2609290 RepID=UPI00301C0095